MASKRTRHIPYYLEGGSRAEKILFVVVLATFLFYADGLKKWAERMDYGFTREMFLLYFNPLDQFAEANGLNRPTRTINETFRAVAGLEREAGFKYADADVDVILDDTTDADTLRADTATPPPISDTLDPAQADSIARADSVARVDSIAQAERDRWIADSVAAVEARRAEVHTPDKPLRVLLVGDSMMAHGFGAVLERLFENDSLFVSYRRFKHSSGLSRPDFYNWFAQLEAIFKEGTYDAAVVMMGTNDAQDISYRGQRLHFWSESWDRVYRARAGALMDTLAAHTLETYWLGMPPMRTDRFDRRMRHVTDLHKAEAAERHRITFLDTSPYVGDGGAYTTHAMLDGDYVSIRHNDGIHFAAPGGMLVARAVRDTLLERFRFRTEPIEPPDEEELARSYFGWWNDAMNVIRVYFYEEGIEE